jgi:hypothetical protein
MLAVVGITSPSILECGDDMILVHFSTASIIIVADLVKFGKITGLNPRVRFIAWG